MLLGDLRLQACYLVLSFVEHLAPLRFTDARPGEQLVSILCALPPVGDFGLDERRAVPLLILPVEVFNRFGQNGQRFRFHRQTLEKQQKVTFEQFGID